MISAFSGTECIGLRVRSLFIPLSSYILNLFCLVMQESLCAKIFLFLPHDSDGGSYGKIC